MFGNGAYLGPPWPRRRHRRRGRPPQLDTEFGLFLRVLCYTGMRISEALGVTLGQLNLKRGYIYLPRTKNNEPPAKSRARRRRPRARVPSKAHARFRSR